MSKEQQELLDEAYKNFKEQIEHGLNSMFLVNDGPNKITPLTQEEFINKCKTDTEFSEKWGLSIQERELSLKERYNIALPIWKEQYGPLADMMVPTNVDNTPFKIPTKLITISYNDQTIESYE
jgi:hypothetical protein